MRRAWVTLRPLPHYRREAFAEGLKAEGYRIELSDPPGQVAREDVVVIWNRYGTGELTALAADRAGAAVLVAENAYLGEGYALALDQHNGAGRWFPGGPERWGALGLEPAPWRRDGDHILLLPQRGIGPNGVAMPMGWTEETLAALRGRTRRPLRVREHPGRHAPERSLEDDLAGAWCAVTWGSGAGLRALLAGVPVFNQLPRWIGATAATPLSGADLERPRRGDRLGMLQRLAWAQWSVEEIARGVPFRHLLSAARQG